MPHILKNKTLEVVIDLPKEDYQYSRFDWTGKITSVVYKGKSITGNELPQPNNHLITGRGLYNEFGIDKAVGFDSIDHGDWFHKIGVGLLQKNTSNYQFHHPYKIIPADFKIEKNTTSIKLRCFSKAHNGYAYLLEKEITLLKDGFVINYQLENKGYKAIITSEYNHNFLTINDDSIGKNYTLKFDFKVNENDFDEKVNPNNLVVVKPESITFTDKPNSDFFFSAINGNNLVDAKWYLENKAEGIGISETGNFKTSKINLWGCGHVISPELFIDINLKPKESMSWTRQYLVYDT